MKRFLHLALAGLLLFASVPAGAADVKPLVNDAGKVRPVHTGETVPVLNGGTGSTTASAARTALGVQASDAELSAIAGLTSAADKVPYFTGSGTAAVTDLTSTGRSPDRRCRRPRLMRTTLGLGTFATGNAATPPARRDDAGGRRLHHPVGNRKPDHQHQLDSVRARRLFRRRLTGTGSDCGAGGGLLNHRQGRGLQPHHGADQPRFRGRRRHRHQFDRGRDGDDSVWRRQRHVVPRLAGN
jgi:hypothetical protein